MDCCEPYPHSWQVWDKDAKEFKKVPGMRVFDVAVASFQMQMPAPLMEASSGAKAASKASAAGDDTAAEAAAERKEAKKEKKKSKEPKADKKSKDEVQVSQATET